MSLVDTPPPRPHYTPVLLSDVFGLSGFYCILLPSFENFPVLFPRGWVDLLSIPA